MISSVRHIARYLRRTPFHPQWLLGPRGGTVSKIARLARGTVLDVGCADRWLESQLPGGCKYIGVDSLATGRALYGATPDLIGDARQLPLNDASVDTVVMLEVLEHVRNPAAALTEAARVLRPGGQLLLSMPFLYPIHDAPFDFQRLTIHGLVKEIGDAGLTIDEVEPTLGSAESAGLITCLTLGGIAIEVVNRRSAAVALVPFMLAAIPMINVGAWLLGRLAPSWTPCTAGYLLAASK